MILQVVLDAIVGIDVTVVYCTTVKPLDVSFITKFPNHKVLIFEHYYSGALLTNILRKEGNLVGSYSNIGVPNEFINKYGNKEEVDKLLGLDAKTIRDKIMEKIYE